MILMNLNAYACRSYNVNLRGIVIYDIPDANFADSIFSEMQKKKKKSSL